MQDLTVWQCFRLQRINGHDRGQLKIIQNILQGNRERGRKGEEGKVKRERVGMAKDFDFHMPVIYFMFELTIRVASTTTTSNFEKITQLRSWVNTIFQKFIKFVNSSDI